MAAAKVTYIELFNNEVRAYHKVAASAKIPGKAGPIRFVKLADGQEKPPIGAKEISTGVYEAPDTSAKALEQFQRDREAFFAQCDPMIMRAACRFMAGNMRKEDTDLLAALDAVRDAPNDKSFNPATYKFPEVK